MEMEAKKSMEIETRKCPNATLKQAAQFLQLSGRSVQKLQERGLLKPVYFGKRRFFRWAELEKLARKGVPGSDAMMISDMNAEMAL